MNTNSNKFTGEGLTFDDVLVLPSHSQVMPRDVKVETRLTRNININVPIISSAMDTVTESALAIAIAKEGGLGILHKNMSIEGQAEEVRRVKRSESGMIMDPITLQSENSIGEALDIMKENQIGGIPITNGHRKLVGILTNRDLRFEMNMGKPIHEVMTKDNLVTAPVGTDLSQAEKILKQFKIEKLLVVDEEGKLAGLITYKDILKLQSFPNACKDDFGRLRVGAAVGIASDMEQRLDALIDIGVDLVCVDTAHGHSQKVLDVVKEIKNNYPDMEVIAGNVATGEGAKAIVNAGADAVKVGVGPGSICTTRVIAGVGVPQLSAIWEAASGIKGSGVPIIADGGIRYSGDIVKAIVAGADSIMAGSLFAGVEESPGEAIIFEGRKFKIYRGMGSLGSMKEGSKDRYFQDAEDDLAKLVPEGIEGRLPYKGKLSEVMAQYIGGLRAGMGYSGAVDIPTLQDAKFVKISRASVIEGHPHDITITKEAPNYSR